LYPTSTTRYRFQASPVAEAERSMMLRASCEGAISVAAPGTGGEEQEASKAAVAAGTKNRIVVQDAQRRILCKG
jgi:hypothetical protein